MILNFVFATFLNITELTQMAAHVFFTELI